MINKELSDTKRALLEKWLKGRQPDPGQPGIPRRPIDSPVLLSFPQQRQLFLELLDRGTAVNNLPVFIRMQGMLDPGALEKSANQILGRHDALRTRFAFGQGLPVPEILNTLGIAVPIVDLQHLEAGERERAARSLAEKEVLQPFDLSKAPLIRLKLYRTDPAEHFLLAIAHHTIADGWSLGVFIEELMAFYQANTTGRPAPLPELPVQYADYAYWQNRDDRQAIVHSSLSYWKEQLGGELPVLELPLDRQRGGRQTFSGGTHRFILSKETTEALEQLGRREDATLFMTLLTIFYILLHRYSGQDEILIGTPIANRNLPELEPLIGVFINTLVLRTNLSGDPGFRELLRRVRKISLEAYAHQDLPFEHLVEALKPKRDLSRPPLFQVVFNLQNAPMPMLDIAGLKTTFLEIDRGVSQFDLTLMMTKTAGQIHAAVEYNNDLFQATTITRMFQSFRMLMENALARPDRPVSRLPFVTPEEVHRLVFDRNQKQLDFPRDQCVHQLFEVQAGRTPDAAAVIYHQTPVTYAELNRRANALAGHLQQLGVGPETRVGILMNRSAEMIVALLGVLKSGGAYVPIHTAFPPARIQFILKDAQIQVLLTNFDIESLDRRATQVIHLKDIPLEPEVNYPNPPHRVAPDQLANAIYTSGSTGIPKGVMIPHAALTNFLWSMRNKPGIGQGDVLMAVTSISFDIAALELFLPLIAGATVVMASEEMLANPALLGKAIDHHQVNMMQATPATWQLLLETGWQGRPDLKALCGGEALTRKLANRLLGRVGSLWNMYGPTETTIWSAINPIQKENGPVTIGQPIGNTQLYILDRYRQPLPPGVTGELYIGGEGLARGYLNQPDLTEEKFIPDPFSSRAGARLYKTGDHARYLENDDIEILGRMDDQVKINGHRIELGEITAVLTQHPAVEEAIVIARTERSGDSRLVAYFVARQIPAPGAAELRDFAGKKLPSYMLPTQFVRLDALPLTPNGKIDRKALPLPEDSRHLPGYVAPRNETEQILAEIWQNVLDMEQVGVYDNFFDLGGASMQSLQIVAKANMFGLRLGVEHIFEHQTIAGLAGYLAQITPN